MKTLATFSVPIEAHLLISRLEGNGIPASLRDEHSVTRDLLGANAAGGMSVNVSDEDFDRARELLAAGPSNAAG